VEGDERTLRWRGHAAEKGADIDVLRQTITKDRPQPVRRSISAAAKLRASDGVR
jgi:hypothetical protein